ncbi:MAG: iron ABC transporter permease [Desulfobacteraceae bacterium]|nr:iron ABC transporter permease [Desulfobacteraceae bacterium]
MKIENAFSFKRLILTTVFLLLVLGVAVLIGLSVGSSAGNPTAAFEAIFSPDPSNEVLRTIIWRIRLPRVLLAILVGAALSCGGLVFQALMRNPLAEPYILGISGGSAIGAIVGILMGFSRFPGVGITAFAGSMATLGLILVMSSGRTILKKDALLLSGVMINAFCSAIIMFLLSITQDQRLHNIMFWLMGDLSIADLGQTGTLAVLLLPCVVLLFMLSHAMNLLLMGKEMAKSMGVNITTVTFTMLIVTTFMVSATVSQSGLLGFVGLVIPHLLRMLLGPDHRILLPSCVLGGGAYMVICDMLARTLPSQGEMPVGVITALIGAPLFIYLLKRSAS